MMVKVVLVDINDKMIKAWRETFEENPEVEILHGSMLEQQVSAWCSPTNSAGRMDGGLDLVIKNHLGAGIEQRLQKEIGQRFHGAMPVGHAVCLGTGRPIPRYLISTPTMVSSSEDISDSLNVALACAAAFQAVNMQNMREPGSVRSVALPGLGANTGRVPVEICADLMWTGFSLFRRRTFEDFAEMRAALEAELGDLGATTSPKANVPAPPSLADFEAAAGNGESGSKFIPGSYGPGVKDEEIDFDDSEDDEEFDDN